MRKLRPPHRSFETGGVLFAIGAGGAIALKTAADPQINLWTDPLFDGLIAFSVVGFLLLAWGLIEGVADKQAAATRCDKLAEFLQQAESLIGRRIGSASDLAALQSEADEWAAAVSDYLRSISGADAARFTSTSGGVSIDYGAAFNQEHNFVLIRLVRLRDNLKTILAEQMAQR